jgi:transglutaminase-like putative cysteine protease
MHFDRRTLLQTGAALTVSAGLPRFAWAYGAFNPQPGPWRQFEIVTRMEIAKPEGKVQAWVPVPSVNETAWFKSIDSTWTSNGKANLLRDPTYGAQFVHAEWKEGETAPVIEVTSKVAARDRAADLSSPGKAKPLSAAEFKFNTKGTDLIPIDGIVKQTSDKITAGAKTDLDKVRAIYEWVVNNSYRDPKTRGCGIGDIVAMLKSGNLGGKCADLNALYVGLVRAAGIPARDVYGIRIAPSRFGYKSLGAGSANITKAQHCRAETFIAGYGWIATDPADVRKVVLEEPPGHLSIDDPKVVDARKTLFGAWEGNWLAYNFGHDIALPGSKGPKLGFLMYPQAECGPSRLDCLDPDKFKYTITAKELPSA